MEPRKVSSYRLFIQPSDESPIKTPATSKSATGSTSRYAILTVNIFLTDFRKSSYASSRWSLCCDHIWSVFSCVQYQAFWARIFLHLPTSTSHLIRLSWSFLFGNLHSCSVFYSKDRIYWRVKTEISSCYTDPNNELLNYKMLLIQNRKWFNVQDTEEQLKEKTSDLWRLAPNVQEF